MAGRPCECGPGPCRAGPWAGRTRCAPRGGSRGTRGAVDGGRFCRVDGMQRVAHSLVLDPRGLGGIDHAARDGDEPASEKAQGGLPVLTVHGDGGVAAHAAPDVHGECVAQLGFIEAVGARRGGAEDRLGRLSHQAAVRGAVVVLVEEGVEADVEIVQRGDRAAEVQAALAERAPEALHLSARRGVVGLGVHQGGAHARARQGQGASAVGGAVVQINGVGRANACERRAPASRACRSRAPGASPR